MSKLDYLEVVKEIESRGVMPESAPSLEPMKRALDRILPRSAFPPERTIVVAGTNGKGSVCATLEALLLSAGQTTGLYTSPHLEETTERIRISGKDISRDDFCEVYTEVLSKTKEIRLSHFEVLTLMAAWIFFSGKITPVVQWAIFEVGLGGLWDATNAIPHQNCIITTLGYDHQNLLGNTLTEITSNKFGIIGPHAHVVHSPLPEEVLPLAEKIKAQTQSRWLEAGAFDLEVSTVNREPQFELKSEWGKAKLALPGNRAAQNTMTALRAFQKLGFRPENHLSALEKVRWPGRMEKIHAPSLPCPVYLSGDHNPDGIRSLIEILKYFQFRHLYIIVGVGKDKDRDGILGPLFDLERASVFLTETPFKGCLIQNYGPWLEKAANAHADPMKALHDVRNRANSDDLIVVTGSLYLVGAIRHAF